MRVLRSGLVAVIVAMLTAAGLVVSSAPAMAEGTGPWNDPSRFPMAEKYPDATTAWDVPVSDREQWKREVQELVDRAPHNSGEVLVGPGLAARGVTSIAGSAEAVKSGTAMLARTCGTGTACKKMLQAGWGLLGLGRLADADEDQVDVTTTETDPDTGAVGNFGPGSFYPATSVSNGPTLHLTAVGRGLTAIDGQIDTSSGDGVCYTASALINYSTNSYITYRASYVNKATGQFTHVGAPLLINVNPNGPTTGCIDPTGSNRDAQDYELRFFSIVANRPIVPGSMANESDNGFVWGQEFLPEGSQLRSTTRCQQPGGAEYSVTSAVSALGSASVGVPRCNTGDIALWNELQAVLPDGSVASQSVQNLRPYSDPAYGPTEEENAYPLCSGGNCLWIIKIGGTWCAKGVAGCTDWSKRPAEAKCFLGPYEMPLTRCGFLERVYENNPERVPATRPNSDGDPDTYEGPVPQPAPAPSATPRPTSTTTPRPVPSGSTSPTPGPSSSSPTLPLPCTAGQACTDPPVPEPERRECFPTGWGAFNPVEWVKRPVGCALREAFVPDPAVVTSVTTSIRTDVTSSGAGQIITTISGPINALGSGSGCDGIQFDLPIGGQSFHGSILNACSGSMATAAHISTAIVGLSTVLGGGLALLRLAGAGFGYNVKVSDGD